MPTETVYGLAANALDPDAIEKIFAAKERPKDNPLIVHISRTDSIEKYAHSVPESARKLAKAFWPGPITMIFEKTSLIPDVISAGQTTVALRMPNHPLLQALLETLPFPLAAPSANPFMYISPVSADHVFEQLGGRLPYILDGGRCEYGIESTIVSFEGEQAVLLRAGAIERDMIELILDAPLIDKTKNTTIKRAGMYHKHYSPHTPCVLGTYEEFRDDTRNIGYITFSRILDMPTEQQYQLSTKGDMREAAYNLYHALHKMDTREFDVIVAELLPDTGIGSAINERLRKATHQEK